VSFREKKNPAASARDRLLVLARERGEDFQLLLTRYGLERLLYRLTHSPHYDRFVLKGAMLFILWSGNPHRPTRDVDFLGSGDSNEAALLKVFRDLCAMPDQEDGVTFDPETVRIAPIRDDTEYGGMRVTLTGRLAGARIPIQADIGFGDAVTPKAVEMEYPTLLGGPAPRLWTYPRETVIAEKYQALVSLGMANSRMKDFYDLWVMARDFDFQGESLATAIGNTFARRRTELVPQACNFPQEHRAATALQGGVSSSPAIARCQRAASEFRRGPLRGPARARRACAGPDQPSAGQECPR
jgi:predicted nucleotidyltransferase component of viral defense system